MVSGTVSAGYAGQLFNYAISQGAEAGRLAALSGIAPEMLEDPDGRIPLASYVAAMRSAKELCNMPSFALRFGAARDFREFSVAGLICYASETMGEALAELNRYGRLVADVDLSDGKKRFELIQSEGELWLHDTRADPNAVPELTEATWSRFICETARHFPEAAFAKAVHVTHAAPAYAADYAEVWKAPVKFDSHWNAIKIDVSWLSIKLHNPSRYAFGVLSERADRLLEELERDRTARGRVEAALLPVLHKGEAAMEDVAARLGVSRQSLYRQLKDENVTYEDVLDDLRRRLSLYYLNGRNVSVSETAYLVGFSDPSSFSRAFKRWTGVSPSRHKTG
ncbi:MAG TPA: AraC family transcriptional regulator ligand-binding domain-containing protein [Parvularculaceae bacterium]|nr:AraC family transcriptional regulator ligand-binding domain-containing protein [Caulobacterales bacterium]HPE31562.1 AraC family transcriptional regulator ligand-binding domain-containing protein [Parvularculaceae bacterium]